MQKAGSTKEVMHKMSTTLHNPPSKILIGQIDHTTKRIIIKQQSRPNLATKITVLDIEKENRVSKVISLYSKGLSQEERAQELNVDQSTISRDITLYQARSEKANRKVSQRGHIIRVYAIHGRFQRNN